MRQAWLLLCLIAFALQTYGEYPKTIEEKRLDNLGSILKSQEISLFAFKKRYNKDTRNRYTKLWDASLEVMSAMPLVSADSQGGVIITDWYFPDSCQNINCKTTVLLRDLGDISESVKVFVHCKDLKYRDLSNAPTRLNRKLAKDIFEEIKCKSQS